MTSPSSNCWSGRRAQRSSASVAVIDGSWSTAPSETAGRSAARQVDVWVAVIDAVVVGYLVAELGDDLILRIDQVWVTPEARELGFGDGLLAAAIESARKLGGVAVQGESLPGDRQTKNLYERAGIVARLITTFRWFNDPSTAGARFSMKASRPSLMSSERMTVPMASSVIRFRVSSFSVAAASTTLRLSQTASGAAAVIWAGEAQGLLRRLTRLDEAVDQTEFVGARTQAGVHR